MADEIRGLSVEFDADFSKFKRGMKEADKDIGSTQRQLKSLKDSLKLEWDSKKFVQAQAQAQKALEATESKTSLLKARLREMEEAGVTDKTRDEYNWLQEQLDKTVLSGQQLKKQLDELNEVRLTNLTKGIDDFSKSLGTAAKKTKSLSTLAGAALGGMTALGLSTVKEADEIATLATKYDMTTDAIQRFNYVALQTDTASEDLYKGFVKVQGSVADLKMGIESVSTKALSQLNLNFNKFSGKEEQFYVIIDALSKLEDEAKMVSLANDIFGEKMATNLFPLIYAGSDAIKQYRTEFEEMGALSEDQIGKLAEFDNILNRLKTSYTNTGLVLGESFLPLLEDFSAILTEDVLPELRELVDWYKSLDEEQQKTLLSLLLFTAALSPALSLLSKIGSTTSTVIRWLGKMDKATLASYGKWMLLGAAVGSLFAVISNWSKMNDTQKVIALLGSLSAAALAAAVAFGVFHSAWSVGLAIAGIVAGIATATAAIKAAGKDIGANVDFDIGSSFSSSLPEYKIPEYNSSDYTTTNNQSTYIDNSNTIINIEKNDYMSEDDILKAVNKGLKELKQGRK